MRITRDTLLKATRDAIATRLRNERDLVAIYLTGSLLGSDPLLGGTTDVDLVFIHSQQPGLVREITRLSHEITLDIAHHSQAIYHQPRHLRVDAWIGPAIHETRLVLYDTQHWFEFTQAGVVSQFNLPENVLQRAHWFGDAARQCWSRLQAGREESTNAVKMYLKSIENAANAIDSLNGAPLTERRFLLHLPERTQAAGSPLLAAAVDSLLGFEGLDAARLQTWVPAWKETLNALNEQVSNRPIRLHPDRMPYYVRAVEEMASSDQLKAAAWLLFETWTRAANLFPDSSPHQQVWRAACETLQLGPEQLPSRLEALDAFLDTVEELLEKWGQKRGI